MRSVSVRIRRDCSPPSPRALLAAHVCSRCPRWNMGRESKRGRRAGPPQGSELGALCTGGAASAISAYPQSNVSCMSEWIEILNAVHDGVITVTAMREAGVPVQLVRRAVADG